MRALVSSHRNRSRKKRDFSHLWITRINAVTREDRLFYSYSLLILNLYKRQLLLNRKRLVQITLSNKNCFDIISKNKKKIFLPSFFRIQESNLNYSVFLCGFL
ncbi:50S ribosomal protein L20, chloroplastic [Dendrobium catenatum]|uniref:Large ribosomal subunit protein bL20c n=1 Tax=Dendrobium catenatum TaxID=906689 RepID=A0A2I0X0J6_9ASPA|nr:50S ribosomal protein L20, chloroplastic [Dendrobium catenatum]